MKVKTTDVKKFVNASYKTRKTAPKKIGDYVLDESLSNKKAKVYHDPIHDKTIIANRGTTGTISDWANNALYATDIATGNVFNLYNKSDRFQQAKRTQKNALKKYGTVDTNIGHSQSGVITRKLNEKGLTDQVININPASYYEKPKKNEYTYRSTFDPVSAFTTGAKTASDFILNPIKAHSSKFLKKYHKKYLGGAIDETTQKSLMYIDRVLKLENDEDYNKNLRKIQMEIEDEKVNEIFFREIIGGLNPSVYKLLFPKFIPELKKYTDAFMIKKLREQREAEALKKVEKPKKEKVVKPKKEKVEKPKSDKPTIKETKQMYNAMKLEEKKKAELEHEKAMQKILEQRKSDPRVLMMDEISALNKFKIPSLKLMLKQRKIKLSKNGKPLKKIQMIGILSDEIVMKYKKLIPVSKDNILDLISEIKSTKFEDTKPFDTKPIDKLFNKVGNKIKETTNIKKADKFRKQQLMKKIFNAMKVVNKNIDKPFDVDTFEEVTNFDLMYYKKEYYLRDLETNIIYSIKNDLPFERVGLYYASNNKIKLDVKPLPKVDKVELDNIKKADEFRKKQLLKKTFNTLKKTTISKKNKKIIKMNKVKQSILNEIETFKKEIESFKDKYNNTKITINEVNDLIKALESKINVPSPIKTKESSNTIINKIEKKLSEIQQIGNKIKEPLKYDADIGFTLFGYLYLIDKYDLPNILFGLMKNKIQFSITSYSLKFKPSFFFGDTKTKFSKDEQYLVNHITNINLSENKDFYENFFTEIKNFIDNGEDLIFIPLCFELGGGHANMLIYRVSDGVIERFDPHGRSYYGSGEIGSRFNNQLNIRLKELFEVIGNKYLKEYTPVFQMIEPTDDDGFQAIESSFDKNIKDNQGYCQLWSLFFMELVALNKDIDSEELIDKSIEIGEASPQYFKEIITGYVSIIYKEMEQFVKKISKDYKINFEEKNLFTKHRDNTDLINYFYKLKEDFTKKPKKNKIISVNVSKRFINSINKMDQDELDEYKESLEEILDTGKHIGYNGKEITNGERIQFLNELNYLKKK